MMLGIDDLSRWFDIFGLGRKTGLGIAEWPGSLPEDREVPISERASLAYFSAIGQVGVSATPIQMANVAATIARDGIWMRPRLVGDGADADYARQQGFRNRVDLKLSPAAVAAAKEGMVRVINTRAGTGNRLQEPDIVIAGKTGSAQAATLTEPVLDRQGQPVVDAKGRAVRRPVSLNDPRARWYRAGEHGELSHAWFIGYAPADRPRIAFAVMLEYGGGGGTDAGLIAKVLLDACRKHGYLPKKPVKDGVG
jgi:cell division protein FtsI/penicillin-binding protein 2